MQHSVVSSYLPQLCGDFNAVITKTVSGSEEDSLKVDMWRILSPWLERAATISEETLDKEWVISDVQELLEEFERIVRKMKAGEEADNLNLRPQWLIRPPQPSQPPAPKPIKWEVTCKTFNKEAGVACARIVEKRISNKKMDILSHMKELQASLLKEEVLEEKIKAQMKVQKMEMILEKLTWMEPAVWKERPQGGGASSALSKPVAMSHSRPSKVALETLMEPKVKEPSRAEDQYEMEARRVKNIAKFMEFWTLQTKAAESDESGRNTSPVKGEPDLRKSLGRGKKRWE